MERTTGDGASASAAAHDSAVAAGAETYTDPVTGLQVFTTVALLERGSCCDSGCRHCPYPS